MEFAEQPILISNDNGHTGEQRVGRRTLLSLNTIKTILEDVYASAGNVLLGDHFVTQLEQDHDELNRPRHSH